MMPDVGDLYDYSMSDQFVSETRPRPYRVGFRRRCIQSWRDAHCFEEAMRLDDREFKLWIANRAGRDREPQSSSVSDLSALRTTVRNLQRQVFELSNILKQRPKTTSRGLDVAAR